MKVKGRQKSYHINTLSYFYNPYSSFVPLPQQNDFFLSGYKVLLGNALFPCLTQKDLISLISKSVNISSKS